MQQCHWLWRAIKSVAQSITSILTSISKSPIITISNNRINILDLLQCPILMVALTSINIHLGLLILITQFPWIKLLHTGMANLLNQLFQLDMEKSITQLCLFANSSEISVIWNQFGCNCSEKLQSMNYSLFCQETKPATSKRTESLSHQRLIKQPH